MLKGMFCRLNSTMPVSFATQLKHELGTNQCDIRGLPTYVSTGWRQWLQLPLSPEQFGPVIAGGMKINIKQLGRATFKPHLVLILVPYQNSHINGIHIHSPSLSMLLLGVQILPKELKNPIPTRNIQELYYTFFEWSPPWNTILT